MITHRMIYISRLDDNLEKKREIDLSLSVPKRSLCLDLKVLICCHSQKDEKIVSATFFPVKKREIKSDRHEGLESTIVY